LTQALKYYRVLGIEPGASLDDIKKAYRRCARKYHPDLNKSESAAELFISSTEAYQFLVAHEKRKDYEAANEREFIDEWSRHKRDQARRKAYAHAQSRYHHFVNSDLYKSTEVLDRTRVYLGILFALLIIILAINGYIARLKMVDKGFEKPTLAGFIFLMFIGLLFLTVSIVFLYHHDFKKRKKN